MIAGVAQLVERQPSKLNVAGSNPVSRSKLILLGVPDPSQRSNATESKGRDGLQLQGAKEATQQMRPYRP